MEEDYPKATTLSRAGYSANSGALMIAARRLYSLTWLITQAHLSGFKNNRAWLPVEQAGKNKAG